MATISERFNRAGDLIGFQVRIRKPGYSLVVKTFSGETEAKARKAAERFARDTESAMDSGNWRDLKKETRQAANGEWSLATPLADLLTHYRNTVTPSKKGQTQETARINWWLRQSEDGNYTETLAATAIGDITKKQIAEWRDDQVAVGKAPSTIKNKLTIISQVFQIAENELGLTVTNPIRGMRLPRARQGRERRFKDRNEEAAVYRAADTVGPWFGRMVRLAVETAMRRGELLSLTRGSLLSMMVDGMPAHVVHLQTTKNGEARSVPLTREAKRLMDELIAAASDDGRLFPVTGDRVSEAWRTTVRLAGVEDLTFHDLRHEATSRLFEHGLPAMEVAAITGHKTLDMLKRYTHFAAARLALKLADPILSEAQRANPA